MELKRLFNLVFVLLALPVSLQARNDEPDYYSTKDNDVQFRTGFEFEKKFMKRFAVSWSEELRLRENLGELDRIHSELSLSYKAASWLKLSAAYTFISVDRNSNKKNKWDLRHRMSLGTTFSYKTPNNWVFSLKEKAQAVFYTEDGIDKREKSDPKWVLKSKAMAEYKFSKIPLEPFVSVELCNTLNAPKYADGEYLEKVRSAIGAVYSIDKHNSIKLFYRFDYNFNKKIDVKKSTGILKSITEEKEYNNIISVSYKYKF